MAVPSKPRTKDALGEPIGIVATVVLVKHIGEGWVENATTTIQLPCPYSKCQLIRAAVYADTIIADSDGVATYQLIKREGAGNSDDPISAAVNFEGATVKEMVNVELTGTVADRTFLNLEVLEIDLVSDSAAINTDAVGFTVILEFVLTE